MRRVTTGQRWLGLLVGLGFAVLPIPAAARPTSTASSPLVLAPRFTRVASGVWATSSTSGPDASIRTNGRYVFVHNAAGPGAGSGQGAPSGLVIDERTGARAPITFPAGCGPTAIGGPWLVFSCSAPPYAELYRLATHRWQALAVSPSLLARCSPAPTGPNGGCAIDPAAIGTRWVEWAWGGGCEHCASQLTFQSLGTGALRTLPAWRPGGRVVPDLDSATLARRLCAPLRVPVDGVPYDDAAGVGAMLFEGPFALAQGSTNGYPPPRWFVQRCGTRRRHVLASGDWPAANRAAIVWPASAQALQGVTLPSLRAVRIVLPATIASAQAAALSANHLYVVDVNGVLWQTRAP